MRHSRDANELFEIARDELRPIICDDSRPCIGMLFSRSLKDGFNVEFLHFLADFPMYNRSTTSVQDAAHKVERTANVEVTDINMPVLMWCNWLRESRTFL